MSLFAYVKIDRGVLPASIEAKGITHAQTYDLDGDAGMAWNAQMLADGRLIVDGEEAVGDREIDVFVVTRPSGRERCYDIAATYHCGRLVSLDVQPWPVEDVDEKPRGFWARALTTLNAMVGRRTPEVR